VLDLLFLVFLSSKQSCSQKRDAAIRISGIIITKKQGGGTGEALFAFLSVMLFVM
jgi:hypothetical protein